MAILIKNGKLLRMMDSNSDFTGDILIEDNKIIKISQHIEHKAGELLIDAKENYVTPGLIDPHCHIGMFEEGMGFEGADGNEMTSPVTSNLDAIYGLNPLDTAFKEAYEAGITTTVTGPGSGNVIGGTFVAVKTYGGNLDKMIIKNPATMKSALGENPKMVYSEQKKSPSTRMAIAAIFRETLIETKEYIEKQENSKKKDENYENYETNFKLEALKDVVNKNMLIKTHAHRADDIMTAVRISKEFNLNMTIDHCTEGHLIAEYLKENSVKPILGPLITGKSKIELKNLSMKAPAILSKAGVKFAMMTDHPVIPIQYLPVQAALAVREGLDKMEALKSITITAAEFTGIDDKVGSIEVGKDADLVIWSDFPLDWRASPKYVIINGKIIYKK